VGIVVIAWPRIIAYIIGGYLVIVGIIAVVAALMMKEHCSSVPGGSPCVYRTWWAVVYDIENHTIRTGLQARAVAASQSPPCCRRPDHQMWSSSKPRLPNCC